MVQFNKFAQPLQLLYFSENGESMSDAQSMKGKCTQVAQDVKAHFDALGAVKEIVHFDGKEINLVTPISTEVHVIKNLVGKDAEANALNGWYARAIMAKNTLMQNIRHANWTQFLTEGEEFEPENFDEKFTELLPHLETFNDDEILGTWTPNEVADYLTKEQYCATVGKLIHKAGKLYDIYNSPLTETSRFETLANGAGMKAYPVTITPVYKDEHLVEFKDMYLAQHDAHREAEKKVNWYKAKLNNEVSDKNAAAAQKYADEMGAYTKKQSEYHERRKNNLEIIRSKNEKLRATCESRRTLLLKEASNLKIFIPDNMRNIKKFVQEYSAVSK